jgi:uncharacterized protein
MTDDISKIGGRMTVPLFPLPNVVLFPRAVMPLHIFEERYKEMTAHVLSADRLVAMALLQPGWERSYHTSPTIEPVVCIGRIVSYEQLADGCYNFLLLGVARARIVTEKQVRPFRIAEMDVIESRATPEPELAGMRRRLLAVFERGAFRATSIARQFRQMFADGILTVDLADLIAFNFLDDNAVKQDLLAETDVGTRIDRLLSALESDPPPPSLNVASVDIVLPIDEGPSLN